MKKKPSSTSSRPRGIPRISKLRQLLVFTLISSLVLSDEDGQFKIAMRTSDFFTFDNNFASMSLIKASSKICVFTTSDQLAGPIGDISLLNYDLELQWNLWLQLTQGTGGMSDEVTKFEVRACQGNNTLLYVMGRVTKATAGSEYTYVATIGQASGMIQGQKIIKGGNGLNDEFNQNGFMVQDTFITVYQDEVGPISILKIQPTTLNPQILALPNPYYAEHELIDFVSDGIFIYVPMSVEGNATKKQILVVDLSSLNILFHWKLNINRILITFSDDNRYMYIGGNKDESQYFVFTRRDKQTNTNQWVKQYERAGRTSRLDFMQQVANPEGGDDDLFGIWHEAPGNYLYYEFFVRMNSQTGDFLNYYIFQHHGITRTRSSFIHNGYLFLAQVAEEHLWLNYQKSQADGFQVYRVRYDFFTQDSRAKTWLNLNMKSDSMSLNVSDGDLNWSNGGNVNFWNGATIETSTDIELTQYTNPSTFRSNIFHFSPRIITDRSSDLKIQDFKASSDHIVIAFTDDASKLIIQCYDHNLQPLWQKSFDDVDSFIGVVPFTTSVSVLYQSNSVVINEQFQIDSGILINEFSYDFSNPNLTNLITIEESDGSNDQLIYGFSDNSSEFVLFNFESVAIELHLDSLDSPIHQVLYDPAEVTLMQCKESEYLYVQTTTNQQYKVNQDQVSCAPNNAKLHLFQNQMALVYFAQATVYLQYFSFQTQIQKLFTSTLLGTTVTSLVSTSNMKDTLYFTVWSDSYQMRIHKITRIHDDWYLEKQMKYYLNSVSDKDFFNQIYMNDYFYLAYDGVNDSIQGNSLKMNVGSSYIGILKIDKDVSNSQFVGVFGGSKADLELQTSSNGVFTSKTLIQGNLEPTLMISQESLVEDNIQNYDKSDFISVIGSVNIPDQVYYITTPTTLQFNMQTAQTTVPSGNQYNKFKQVPVLNETPYFYSDCIDFDEEQVTISGSSQSCIGDHRVCLRQLVFYPHYADQCFNLSIKLDDSVTLAEIVTDSVVVTDNKTVEVKYNKLVAYPIQILSINFNSNEISVDQDSTGRIFVHHTRTQQKELTSVTVTITFVDSDGEQPTEMQFNVVVISCPSRCFSCQNSNQCLTCDTGYETDLNGFCVVKQATPVNNGGDGDGDGSEGEGEGPTDEGPAVIVSESDPMNLIAFAGSAFAQFILIIFSIVLGKTMRVYTQAVGILAKMNAIQFVAEAIPNQLVELRPANLMIIGLQRTDDMPLILLGINGLFFLIFVIVQMARIKGYSKIKVKSQQMYIHFIYCNFFTLTVHAAASIESMVFITAAIGVQLLAFIVVITILYRRISRESQTSSQESTLANYKAMKGLLKHSLRKSTIAYYEVPIYCILQLIQGLGIVLAPGGIPKAAVLAIIETISIVFLFVFFQQDQGAVFIAVMRGLAIVFGGASIILSTKDIELDPSITDNLIYLMLAAVGMCFLLGIAETLKLIKKRLSKTENKKKIYAMASQRDEEMIPQQPSDQLPPNKNGQMTGEHSQDNGKIIREDQDKEEEGEQDAQDNIEVDDKDDIDEKSQAQASNRIGALQQDDPMMQSQKLDDSLPIPQKDQSVLPPPAPIEPQIEDRATSSKQPQRAPDQVAPPPEISKLSLPKDERFDDLGPLSSRGDSLMGDDWAVASARGDQVEGKWLPQIKQDKGDFH